MRSYRIAPRAAALGLAFSFVVLGSPNSTTVKAVTVDHAAEAACTKITAANHGYCCKLRAAAMCKMDSASGQSMVDPSRLVAPFQQLAQSTGRGINDDDGTGSVFGSEDPADSVGRGLEGNGGGGPGNAGGGDMGGDMSDNTDTDGKGGCDC